MKPARSKSETRKRTRLAAVRMSPEEHARASERAAERGLSLSAYFRLKALGESGPRSQRQARPDRKELARILGRLQKLSAEHNKIGSNINQLARQANTVGINTLDRRDLSGAVSEYQTAIAELAAMRSLLLSALGYHDR